MHSTRMDMMNPDMRLDVYLDCASRGTLSSHYVSLGQYIVHHFVVSTSSVLPGSISLSGIDSKRIKSQTLRHIALRNSGVL